MSPEAIGLILALLCSVFWTGLDVSRKFLGGRASATGAVAGLTLFQIPILLLILGAGEAVSAPELGGFDRLVLDGFPEVSADYWPWALGSIAINLLANFLFLRAVQISPLSLTIPYLSFTPVFTAISGLVALGEEPGGWGWAGILTVCMGAFFLNPGNKDHGPLAPLKALWTERGSLYMVIVALSWSITPVLDKYAAERTSVVWHTLMIATGVFAFFAVARIVADRGPRRLVVELAPTAWLFALAASFNVFAMILQLSSYDFTDVAYTETVKRAVGVVGAIAAGYVFFGERDLRRRMLGAAVMVVGVAMIMLA